MNTVRFKIFPAPSILQEYVECFRMASSDGSEGLVVRVCPNGLPGLAFQHSGGRSTIESIDTPSRHDASLPTLFLYGQVTTLSEMHFMPPFVAFQVIFKAHALWSLFDLDGFSLKNKSLRAEEFGAVTLNEQLITAQTDEERVAVCSQFLTTKLPAAQEDAKIAEAIAIIERRIDTVSVNELCKHIGLSERQFERQFRHVVGVRPHFYIRVRRINAALRLMDSGKYGRLVDIAHALRFHDQSHFIHDIKEFTGLTPTSILQKVDSFYQDQVGSSYLLF
jgi:AraC-like DNA-binding protein